MKALANLDKFSAGSSLKSWMFTIMRNSFCTKIKLAKREAPGVKYCVALASAVEPRQQTVVEMAELSAALDRLPEPQRSMVIDVARYGESYEAIAARAGCAVVTVKSRLNRARQHLIDELGLRDST